MKNTKTHDTLNAAILNNKASKSKKLPISRAIIEANARRAVNKRWKQMERTNGYHCALMREICKATTAKIEEEVLDGILLQLKERNESKSASAQNRLLRRIVEKRQAQATHSRDGRTSDLTYRHVMETNTSRSMAAIRKKRFAA